MLLLAAAAGEIGPMPDAAIWADTGGDSQEVADYLDYVEPLVPFPIIRVQKANLRDHIKRSKMAPDGRQVLTLPYYLDDGVQATDGLLTGTGCGGQMQRTCTGTAKIRAVTGAIRHLLGVQPHCRVPDGTEVEVWVGFSMEEKHRARSHRPGETWQTARYPLLEMNLTGGDCVEWLKRNGFRPPPISRCIFCPFRSDEMWRALSPEEFEEACQIDESLRADGTPPRGYKGMPYLHRSRRPLREVDLTEPSIGLPFSEGCSTCGL